MTATLQSALTWTDATDVTVSIVCEAPGCGWSVELAEKDSIATARAHMLAHMDD